jgi:dihydropteroate synthase
MQDDPQYDDVLLDVYDDWLAGGALRWPLGIAEGRIAVDPGIGFGKTGAHNLALIRGLSLFHGLGLRDASGCLAQAVHRDDQGGPRRQPQGAPGSLAVALAGVAQGVQITRVHDVAETRAGAGCWQAMQSTIPREDET